MPHVVVLLATIIALGVTAMYVIFQLMRLLACAMVMLCLLALIGA